ncbi:SpoIIE family protein phosphatase [Marinomonas epiphytica]
MMAGFALKIILVDVCDESSNDLVDFIERQGHDLTQVFSLAEAVTSVSQRVPHLLMIKASFLATANKQEIVDLQELTAELQPSFLLLCEGDQVTSLPFSLNRGGGDFMCQPYKFEYLATKLEHVVKRFECSDLCAVNSDQLAKEVRSTSVDQEMATTLYDNIAKFNNLYDSALTYIAHSNHLFKKDVLLSAKKPDGGLHVFLGRFNNHSFSAVFAAFSMADAFFEMSAKGFSATKVLLKMNDRLKSSLPDYMCMVGALIDLRHHEGSVEIWNAGLPDLLLQDSVTGQLIRFPSNGQCLGLQDSNAMSAQLEMAPISESSIVAMQSVDLEVKLPGLQDILLAGKDQITELQAQIVNHHDDYTFVSIDLSHLYKHYPVSPNTLIDASEVTGGFSFEYELNAQSLKSIDPLPYILQVITAEPGLSKCSGQVFMILSELYSNALEHGVLKLKSDKKATPEGFARYYEDRQKALDSLTDGFVKIKARVTTLRGQSVLQITVEDSGNGFDTERVIFDIPNTEVFYNRGFALLNQLCKRIEFSQGGRSVTASYQLEY